MRSFYVLIIFHFQIIIVSVKLNASLIRTQGVRIKPITKSYMLQKTHSALVVGLISSTSPEIQTYILTPWISDNTTRHRWWRCIGSPTVGSMGEPPDGTSRIKSGRAVKGALATGRASVIEKASGRRVVWPLRTKAKINDQKAKSQVLGRNIGRRGVGFVFLTPT